MRWRRLLGLEVLVCLVTLASCQPDAFSDRHITYCRKLLSHLVKSPTSVKIIESSSVLEDTHIIYDANNSFGVPIRGRIDCWYKQPVADEKSGERAVLTKVWLDFKEISPLIVLETRTSMLTDSGSGSDPDYKPEEAKTTAAKRDETWVLNETTSSMDGSASATLRLSANNPISGWPSKDFTPRLLLRCQEHKTEVFVVTGMAATTDYGELYRTTVRIRFDDGKPVRQTWSESTDREALFAPNPVALARRIAKAKTFRLQFTPFNASPQVAEFTVTGLDRNLGTVAKTCGWKP